MVSRHTYRIWFLLAAVLMLTLAACQPAAPTATPGNPGSENGPGSTRPEMSAPSPASETPQPAAPTATEAAATPAEPAHPWAGLAFTNGEGLWLVDRAGQPQQIIGRQQAVLSPDGRYAAFVDGPPDGSQQDIYLIDRQTGEQRNLTNTPDRIEVSPQFWAANPQVLLFESITLDEPLFGFGHPSVVNLDGSDYRVLDERAGGPMAPAPDGKTIAYGCCDVPGTLYRLEEGRGSPFDPLSYGLAADKLFLPEFGTTSSQLAWILGGPQLANGENTLGVGVFDLQSGEGRLLHPSNPPGTEFSGALAWNPDGEYLAYVNLGEVAGQGRAPNLWVLLADGSQEFNLGIGHDPVWRYDGGALAYSVTPQDASEQRIYVAPTREWGSVQATPYQGVPVGWIQP